MKKKNVALCFSVTSNLLFAVANIIIGIEENSPALVDDIYIFTNDLNNSDISIIKKIRDPQTINIVSLEEKFNQKGIGENTRFTSYSFGVFEIFDLLDSYKKVIYLDPDLVIRGDISPIISFGPMAMIKATGRIISKCFKEVPVGIDGKMHTRNSGVIIVSDDIDYKGLTDFCYDKTFEQKNNNLFADQAMLRYCTHIKSISISDLDMKYNSVYGKRKDDVIVHCVNQDKKPWNNPIVRKLYPEWDKYNDEFIKLGGNDYRCDEYDSIGSDSFNFMHTKSVVNLVRHLCAFYNCAFNIFNNKFENMKNTFDNMVVEKVDMNKMIIFITDKIEAELRYEIRIKNDAILIKKCYYPEHKKIENVKENIDQTFIIEEYDNGCIAYVRKIPLIDLIKHYYTPELIADFIVDNLIYCKYNLL